MAFIERWSFEYTVQVKIYYAGTIGTSRSGLLIQVAINTGFHCTDILGVKKTSYLGLPLQHKSFIVFIFIFEKKDWVYMRLGSGYMV